jgi:hypothetical protein
VVLAFGSLVVVLLAGLAGIGGRSGFKSGLEEKRGWWGWAERGGSVVLAFGSLVVVVVLAGLTGVGGCFGFKSGLEEKCCCW